MFLGAIVLQLGADSLAGDRLGCFNLSVSGHGECVRFVQSFNVPLMLLGGGGYTLRNVARCWTYETSIACNVELDPKLPYHEYYEYFAPDYKLGTIPTNMLNMNKKEYLDDTITTVFKYLAEIETRPSISVQDSRITLGLPTRLQQIQASIGTKLDDKDININKDSDSKPINDAKHVNNNGSGPRLPLFLREREKEKEKEKSKEKEHEKEKEKQNINKDKEKQKDKENKENGCGAPEWDGVLNPNIGVNGHGIKKKKNNVSIRDVRLQQNQGQGAQGQGEQDGINLNGIGQVATIEQEKHIRETLEDYRVANDVDNTNARISKIQEDKMKEDKRELYNGLKDQDKTGPGPGASVSGININISSGKFNTQIGIVKAKPDNGNSNGNGNNNSNNASSDTNNDAKTNISGNTDVEMNKMNDNKDNRNEGIDKNKNKNSEQKKDGGILNK